MLLQFWHWQSKFFKRYKLKIVTTTNAYNVVQDILVFRFFEPIAQQIQIFSVNV